MAVDISSPEYHRGMLILVSLFLHGPMNYYELSKRLPGHISLRAQRGERKWEATLGISRAAVHKTLKGLLAEGLITIIETKPFTTGLTTKKYFLTEKGFRRLTSPPPWEILGIDFSPAFTFEGLAKELEATVAQRLDVYAASYPDLHPSLKFWRLFRGSPLLRRFFYTAISGSGFVEWIIPVFSDPLWRTVETITGAGPSLNESDLDRVLEYFKKGSGPLIWVSAQRGHLQKRFNVQEMAKLKEELQELLKSSGDLRRAVAEYLDELQEYHRSALKGVEEIREDFIRCGISL